MRTVQTPQNFDLSSYVLICGSSCSQIKGDLLTFSSDVAANPFFSPEQSNHEHPRAEPNEPSRAGITRLVYQWREGSARSSARLVRLVHDARELCSARCQPWQQLSIMRSFDPDELQTPLPVDLLKELEWEAQMDEETRNKYRYLE